MKRRIFEDLESGKLFYMEYTETESKPLLAVLEITPEQYKAMTDARRRQDLTEQERGALYDRIIFGDAGRTGSGFPEQKEKAGA